ncbi:MAG: aminopeptidase [Gaiellales bacterium]
MTAMTPAELGRYADAVIDTCLHIKKGDTVAIHGETGSRPYMHALVDAAYAAGARYVDVLYVDPVIRRARITGVRDAGTLSWSPRWHLTRMKDLIAADATLISVVGEENPSLMKGVDPKRAMLEMTARMPGREAYLKAVAAGTARFCVVAYPAPGWAKQVYPKLSVERAQRALAKDLLSFCRIGADDPKGAWGKHVENLVKRADLVNRRNFTQMEFIAPGTDLRVGLAPKTRFCAAEMKTPNGRRWCANLPTEEVFASPDYRFTEGHFTCTRPLSLDGQMFDGIKAEFSGGRLSRVQAKTARQRDYLAAYFARDKGAGRLGEVALVDRASRIGQANRVYHTTLLDENAVAHVALGSSYASTRFPDSRIKGDRGLNVSKIHTDVMIGCDELDVIGVTKQGERVPVIENGTWVLK